MTLRSTKGYINHQDVDLENIVAVVNSDGGNIPLDPITGKPKDVTFDMIFDKLGEVTKSDLYGKFINGDTPIGGINVAPATRDIPTDWNSVDDVVPGDTPEELLTNVTGNGVTTQGYDIGDLRGYGGVELPDGGGEDGGIPEIYWNNVINSWNNEYIPTGDLLTMFIENSLYPVVNVVPDTTRIINNIDTSKITQYNLVDSLQTSYYRDGNIPIYNSNLATKVGIDYPDGQCGLPEFDVKVTPNIRGSIPPTSFSGLTACNEGGGFVDELAMTAFFGALGGAATAAQVLLSVVLENIASEGVQAGTVAAKFLIKDVTVSQLTNGFSVGTIGPTGTGINAETGLAWSGSITVDTGLGTVLKFALPLLEGISYYIAMIQFANIIWDLCNNPTVVSNYPYQYQNVIFGVYNFEDIKNSTYKIGTGNKRYFTDLVETVPINLSGTSHDYTLDNTNYGEPYSETNLIPLFPNRSIASDKFLNFEFYPQCIQYDFNTPPPIIEYFIELIPIKNCKLSETKITKFSITVAPDKYYAPRFTIETAVIANGVKQLFHNTSITFKNARFCDYIYLADTDAAGGWFGLFKTYSNYAIQSELNEDKAYNGSIITTYTGNDITLTGYDIFMTNLGGGFPSSPTSGIYNTWFMQEAQPNMLYNPYFRVEKNDTVGSRLEDLKRFWNYSTNVEIKNGGCYKLDTLNPSYLVQNIPNIRLTSSSRFVYYVLELEFVKTAGTLKLHTTDTCFNDRVFKWNSATYLYTTKKDYYAGGEENDHGIEYHDDDNNIEFLNSGNYRIILETLKSAPRKMLMFDFSTDFEGWINTCKLQYLPYQPTGWASRGATNILTTNNQPIQSFKWMDGSLPGKYLCLIFEADDIISGTIQLLTIEESVDSVDLMWYFTDGTTLEVENAPFYEFTIPETSPIQQLLITLHLNNIYTKDKQLLSLNIDNLPVKYIHDPSGSLLDADVSAVNTLLGRPLTTITKNLLRITDWVTGSFKTRLRTLDISDSIYILGDVSTITSISDSFIANNTNIRGDLSSIISIPHIEMDSTHLISYTLGQPKYADLGVPPYIVWKNSGMLVEHLNKLLYDLDFSTIENGYLDISGDNPEITDTTALEHISNLVDIKGWTVLYNFIDIIAPIITLIGANLININQGDIYIDAGATAYDNNDGDITQNIVTVNNVNIHKIGTYIITYDVKDISNNSAIQVTRTVNVNIPSITELVIGSQTWMSKNVCVNDGLVGISYPNNDINNIYTYGCFYQNASYLNRILSYYPGWHVPSITEWNTLKNYIGSTTSASSLASEYNLWSDGLLRNNPNFGVIGFNMLPAGTSKNYNFGSEVTCYCSDMYNSTSNKFVLARYNATVLYTTISAGTVATLRLIKD